MFGRIARRAFLPALLPALIGALFAAPAAQAEQVGPGYAVGGGNWSTGGGIKVYVRPYERGGRLAVCGAWTTTQQAAASHFLNEQVIETGVLYVGGNRILTNFRFMNRLPENTGPGGYANCIVTSEPWQPGYGPEAVEIRFPRMVFYDGFPGRHDGRKVVFRQGVAPAFN